MSNSIILQDASTQLWSVTVNDSGILQDTTTGAGAVTTVILNDATNAASWQLGVNTSGFLTTTSITLGNYPQYFFLVSGSGNSLWAIGVTLGGLLTTTSNIFFGDEDGWFNPSSLYIDGIVTVF